MRIGIGLGLGFRVRVRVRVSGKRSHVAKWLPESVNLVFFAVIGYFLG